MRKNILITGMPRSGKSTLLKNVISDYKNKVGFVTNEIRENKERVGFEIETSSGERSVLAHVDFTTENKVSRYFVDVKNLEEMIPTVSKFQEDCLIYIDEIGQMELFSEKFKQLTLKYLDSNNICIATVSKIFSDDFIEKIKKRDDIILIEITEQNRISRLEFVKKLITKIVKAKKYSSAPERFKSCGDQVELRSEHGLRKLIKNKDGWACDCEFFKENNICSHVIAIEELIKRRSL